MNTELFINKIYEYNPNGFTEDVDFTRSSSSGWEFAIDSDGVSYIEIDTISGTTADNQIVFSLDPWNVSTETNKWILKFDIQFEDDNITNSLDVFSGPNNKNYTESESTSFSLASALSNQTITFDAGTALKIYNISAVNVIETFSKVELPEETQIKITKSLKDLRKPFNSGSEYSKSFKLPYTKNVKDAFGWFENNDYFISEAYLIKFNSQINFNGVSSLFGTVFLDSISKDSNHNYWMNLIFTSTKKKFFDDAKTKLLYLTDGSTLDNQTASNIYDKINSTKYTGEYAKTHDIPITFGLFERGEDLVSLQTAPSLTQDSATSFSKTGFMEDSFTPGIWAWWMFNKIHENLGYSVSGDLLDDSNFNNLVLPLTRKNWWESTDSLDIDDTIFEGWQINNSDFSTGDLNYQAYTSEANLYSPLHSSSNVSTGNFDSVVGGGYSRYHNLIGLGVVREVFDFSNLSLTYTYTHDPDYYTSHPYYKIRFYVAQQYGDENQNLFHHILLDTVDQDMYSGSTGTVSFNSTNLNKTTTHYYKSTTANKTYFYITWEFYNDTNGETNSNHRCVFHLSTTGSGVETLMLTDSQGDYPSARFDRYFGNQVGTFQLPKETTYFTFINDMIQMFNLVVEVNENDKTISYNKWSSFAGNKTLDLTNYLITDKEIKRDLFATIVPSTYNLKFLQDENDWLTYDYNDTNKTDNPTELNLKYGIKNSNKEELEVQSMFYLDTSFTNGAAGNGVLTNYATYTDDTTEVVSKSNRINYTWNKNLYAFQNFFDMLSYGSTTIWNSDFTTQYSSQMMPTFSYITSSIQQSFAEIENSLSYSIPSDTLFDVYWDPILSTITGNNAFIFSAYFNIDPIIYSKISFEKKIRIGNELYYINKIKDWHPDSPTQIELIKIWKIDI